MKLEWAAEQADGAHSRPSVIAARVVRLHDPHEGMAFGSLCSRDAPHPPCGQAVWGETQSVGNARERVIRVVVVDVAVRVDIPHIIGVATISRAQTDVDRRTIAYCHFHLLHGCRRNHL